MNPSSLRLNTPANGLFIRRGTRADAPGVGSIYTPVVTDTAISFETMPPNEAELAQRIEHCNRTHAWLVAEAGGPLAGYAYGTAHRAREAYRFSVETSVYVHPAHQGRGVGAALYARLFQELAELGYFHAFAAVTLPNDASTRLHASVGFRRIGTFPRVGFKFGRWHDVSWWHKMLRHGKPEVSD